MTRVARCKACGRDVMAVSIEYIEDEDIEQFEEYQQRGYEIVNIESKDLNMITLRCNKCPAIKEKL